MPAKILEGRDLGRSMIRALRGDVDALHENDAPPNLASLQVGECEASRAYIQFQKRACTNVGILYTHTTLDAKGGERQVLAHVRALCSNPEVTGVIVQLPVPDGVDIRKAYHLLDPTKDVEGMHPANLGSVLLGETGLQPCTALAVMALIRESGVTLRGAEVCVVGHSHIVGKPIGMMLLNADATVTTCHAHTANLAAKTRLADVLVVAAGRPGLITGEHVKPGAVVIDVGVNFPEGAAQPVGDVCFEEAVEVAGYVSPVPGGVGPLTVAMLVRNTIHAAQTQFSRRRQRRAEY
jgi:methylenetetrahydrofolate dehydrogenase (NADP+) / methenyltetrahydrofolate cyclohydrolase